MGNCGINKPEWGTITEAGQGNTTHFGVTPPREPGIQTNKLISVTGWSAVFKKKFLFVGK